jgi:hypothetical protein
VGSSCSNRGDDAYSDSHEEEKDNLTNEETLRFLSKMPHGVFQYGAFTVGPLGLRRSLNHRRIPGRRRGIVMRASGACIERRDSCAPPSLASAEEASVLRDRTN